MGSENFTTQLGNGVVAGVGRKRAEGVGVGNGVRVGNSVNISVGALAGSAGMGLPIMQAKVRTIVPAEKNKSLASLIFSRLLKKSVWITRLMETATLAYVVFRYGQNGAG